MIFKIILKQDGYMKKIFIASYLIFISLFSVWASNPDESIDKNKTTEKSKAAITPSPIPSPPQTFGTIFHNIGKGIKANLYDSSETEKNKFPNFKLSKFLNCCNSPDISHSDMIGKHIAFSTGSSENSADYYKGQIVICSIDYGDEVHNYQGPQEGYKTPTLSSKKEEVKPNIFITNWIKANCDLTPFKGTPVIKYAGNETKYHIEYHARRQNPNEYIIIEVYRTPEK